MSENRVDLSKIVYKVFDDGSFYETDLSHVGDEGYLTNEKPKPKPTARELAEQVLSAHLNCDNVSCGDCILNETDNCSSFDFALEYILNNSEG